MKVLATTLLLSIILTLSACQTSNQQNNLTYSKKTYLTHIERLNQKIKAQQLSDADLTELFLVANELTNEKLFLQAAAFYEAVYNHAPNIVTGIKLSRIKRLVEKEDEAIQIVKKLELLFPKHAEPPLELASIYALKSQKKAALEELSEAYQRLPDSEELAVAYADLLLDDKKRKAAKKVLSEALKKHPVSDILLLKSARIKAEDKDYLGAKNDLNILMRTSPENIETWTLAGLVASEEKNFKAAETYFREAFERRPENNTLARYFVLQLIKQEKYSEAKRILQRIEQTSDEQSGGFDAELKYQYAFVLLQLEEYQAAKDKFSTLIDDADDPGRIIFYMGQCDEFLLENSTAKSEYQKIQSTSAFYRPAQQRIFVIEITDGKIEDAKETLLKLEQKQPDSESEFRFFANAYAKLNNYQKAQSFIKMGLKQSPNSEDLLYLDAAYTEYTKSKSASLSKLELFVKKHPNYSQALNHLGYSLSEQQDRLQYAEKLLRKAISIEPKNSFYLDSLGWILFKQKKYHESEIYLMQSIKIDDQEPVLFEHIGELYFAQKNFSESLKYFQMAETLFEKKSQWRIESDPEWKSSFQNVKKRVRELQQMALPQHS